MSDLSLNYFVSSGRLNFNLICIKILKKGRNHITTLHESTVGIGYFGMTFGDKFCVLFRRREEGYQENVK